MKDVMVDLVVPAFLWPIIVPFALLAWLRERYR